jgi:hypothetical protein
MLEQDVRDLRSAIRQLAGLLTGTSEPMARY